MASLVPAELSAKDSSPSDPTAVPSACFGLGCTDLSQRSYKGFPKYSPHKHNPDYTIKLHISYQNLFLFPHIQLLSPAARCGTSCLLNGAVFFP